MELSPSAQINAQRRAARMITMLLSKLAPVSAPGGESNSWVVVVVVFGVCCDGAVTAAVRLCGFGIVF